MSDATQPPAGKFNAVRVLIIVVPIILAAVAALAVISSGGSFGFGSSTPKIEVTQGKLMMRGKPMAGVMLQTTVDGRPELRGGIATTREDGTFEFETDNNGELVPGLYVGKHKVTAIKFLPGPGVGYGPLVTPKAYQEAESTPLVFEISSGDTNDLGEIVLELDDETPTEEFIENYLKERAEASAQPTPPRFNPAAPDNGGAAPPGGGGGFDPAAFFADRDADGDGKLSGDEIPERMQERVEELDTDGDGSISKEEFDAAGPPAGRGGRGGRGGPGGGAPGGGGEASDQASEDSTESDQ